MEGANEWKEGKITASEKKVIKVVFKEETFEYKIQVFCVIFEFIGITGPLGPKTNQSKTISNISPPHRRRKAIFGTKPT